jgi:hypothetical protein
MHVFRCLQAMRVARSVSHFLLPSALAHTRRSTRPALSRFERATHSNRILRVYARTTQSRLARVKQRDERCGLVSLNTTTQRSQSMEILGTILRYVFAIVGMAAVAFVVWKVVNRQEAKDTEFQKKLDDDDERASKGRFGPPPR